jgi:hypothetical protein
MAALGVAIGLTCGAVILLGMAMIMPVRLRLTVGDSALVVEPLIPDVLLTLRRRIEVPLDQVMSVRVVPRSEAPLPAPRLPGAHLLGVCTAGSFGLHDERTFWDVRRADAVIMINCTAHAPYRALVLEFAEPDLVASRVRDALAH